MKYLKIKQPKLLAQLVVERVRQAIIDGDFALGEQISEERLAESLGVSRTPVRDAMIRLQLQGLVSIQPKRGTFVFDPVPQDVIDVCRYRKMLETGAIRLALGHARAALVKDLQIIVARMSDALADGDAVAYGRLDSNLHQCFVNHSGNPYIREAYDLVSGQIAALRTTLTSPAHDLRRISFGEHERFLAMATDNQSDALCELLGAHIDRTEDVFAATLKGRREARKADEGSVAKTYKRAET